jgi:hypothetical protein
MRNLTSRGACNRPKNSNEDDLFEGQEAEEKVANVCNKLQFTAALTKLNIGLTIYAHREINRMR